MVELKKANLLGIIESCLKEHQVTLSVVGVQTAPFYLIEGKTSSTLVQDFIDTYPEIDDFKRRIANKLMNKPQLQTYGILVDSGLKYAFAFNRKFADLSKDRSHLVFKSPEDLLLEASNNLDLANDAENIPPKPTQIKPPQGFGPVNIRYAIVGKTSDRDFPEEAKNQDYSGSFGRPSLLDRIKTDYEQMEIKLKESPDERFFLINTLYETSGIDDFVETYKTEIDEFKLKLAKKIFGDKKSVHNYGLVFDNDLTIRFAFNTIFAKYNPKNQQIEYASVEDLLLNGSGNTDFSINPGLPHKRTIQIRRPDQGSVTYKYAVVGKRD